MPSSKKRKCSNQKCNQFVIYLGSKTLCKIHFYEELGHKIIEESKANA